MKQKATLDDSRRLFTFFWSGPFSQWHGCRFTIEGLEFNCAEQFMMYCKAQLFFDNASAQAILNASTPRQQKALGRKVQNFDEPRWNLFREGIVFAGNYAKFSQNETLKDALLATGDTQLVEASPKDRIWGIGLSEDDPRATNPAQWRGLNLLGIALTRVRGAIRSTA